MKAFITGEDIELKEYLFGRDDIIERLISFAIRHEIAGLVAPRRFGKTCVLKTMATILRESDGDAYPVYFSAHDYSIRNNTDEVFCRLATAVATRMCIDGIIPEGEIDLFRKTPVYISSDPIDNFESFCNLTSERQRESLFKLAEKLRAAIGEQKYLLLLLDEIDYLLLTAFESPDDFMRIREAATKKQASLKFWIAGPASWKHMCTSIGSPGLNCGLESIPLRPLGYSDFKKMWEYECDLIEDNDTKNNTLSQLDYAYEKSGGVPFYAKFIGRQYQLETNLKTQPTFTILRDYLDEMYHNKFFTDDERLVMSSLAMKPIIYGDNEPEGVSTIIEKGIAYKQGSHTMMKIGYLADYLRSCKTQVPNSNSTPVIDNTQSVINELVNEINCIMLQINDTYNNKQGKMIFENPMHVLMEDVKVREICRTREAFGDFLSLIYNMYYERSKALIDGTATMKPGQRLYELDYLTLPHETPLRDNPNYYRNRDFFKIIEPLRAAYDAHIPEKLARDPGQLTHGEALELLKGNKNAPEDNEWPNLQIHMLEFFKQELNIIKSRVYFM